MMKRIFLAISAGRDPALIQRYDHIREILREEKIKWVKPGNLHLTLHFFGDTGVEEIRLLDRLLQLHTTGLQSFDLVFNGAGVFPGMRKPRVLWFGLTAPEGLDVLVEAVKEVLAEGGFALPDKPFSPHLTIGRIKWIGNRQRFAGLLEEYREKEISRLTVHEVCLFESILKPEGPEYRVMKRYRLEN